MRTLAHIAEPRLFSVGGSGDCLGNGSDPDVSLVKTNTHRSSRLSVDHQFGHTSPIWLELMVFLEVRIDAPAEASSGEQQGYLW